MHLFKVQCDTGAVQLISQFNESIVYYASCYLNGYVYIIGGEKVTSSRESRKCYRVNVKTGDVNYSNVHLINWILPEYNEKGSIITYANRFIYYISAQR